MSENTKAVPDSTQTDDSAAAVGQTEEALLADIVRNSAFTQNEESLPTEQVPELDPGLSDQEDPNRSDEPVSEEVEEGVETEEVESEGEDADVESATQDPTIFTPEELDLEAKVSVKIDGKDTDVSFNDLIKGYSTEQSLSKKGRELGDARKGLEEEYGKRMEEIQQLSQASVAVLYADEQQHAKKYHEIEEQVKKAREDNDSFKMSELKDEREQAQQSYWEARNKREGMLKTLQANNQKLMEESWNKQLESFNKNIPDLIPDFNETTAKDIREFALAEGLKPELVDTIVDPAIVKFVDDYRRLKQGITKGSAKRKLKPTKQVPVRKARSPSQKKTQAANDLRTRALGKNSTKADQDAFLKTIAERSLNKL